jgi:hypothetical protein
MLRCWSEHKVFITMNSLKWRGKPTGRISRFAQHCDTATVSFGHVCTSAWTNSAPTGRMFMKFDIWVHFENLLRKFKFQQNLTRITGRHFAWRPLDIFDHISQSSSLNEKCFRQNLYRKSKHTFCVQQLSSKNRAVYEIMWKNMVERGKQETTIWRMRLACWIKKVLPILFTVDRGTLQFLEYHIVQFYANQEKQCK